jgi:molybdate transport system ATP-binding protein
MLEASLYKKLWHFDLEIQLKVNNNQILTLLGPSGCGKTTTLNLLAGLFKADQGVIKLDDRVLYSSEDKINIHTQARNVAYLFQNNALFPHMTVLKNVTYGLRTRRNKNKARLDPLELLNSFGVGHLADRYPSQISGGEKQRVALARALVVQPELLLLDEPFSALDKDTKVYLRHELKQLHKKWQIPFVLVTHDEEDAKFLGDITIVMKKGKPIGSSLKIVTA